MLKIAVQDRRRNQRLGRTLKNVSCAQKESPQTNMKIMLKIAVQDRHRNQRLGRTLKNVSSAQKESLQTTM